MSRGERGITLVELIIAVAISAIVVTAVGPLIYQTLHVTVYGSDKLIAAHEMQHAAHQLGGDIRMAKQASGGSGEMTLTLPDGSYIAYVLADGHLYRQTAETKTILARNITAADFKVDNGIVTVTITAAPAGRWAVSEQGTYIFSLRPTTG